MKRYLCALSATVAAAAPVLGSELEITFENLQAPGGFAFTPLWLGAHDGTFDVFDAGSAGVGGIEEIAEVGDASVLGARFSAEQPGGAATVFAEPNGPPVFSPGESASTTLDVGDASVNRFFSFASMLVPTNDLFIGNDIALELFDGAGNFNGPVVIEFRGSNIYDAGTEVNDFSNGPAFVVGVNGGDGAVEGGVVTLFFSSPDAGTYLDSILGATTPGGEVTTSFGRDTVLARLTIVPAPSTGAMAGLAGLMLARRRRR